MTTSELKLPIELDELIAILKSAGVKHASVFGSYARGEARPDSDLDLLVELEPEKSLFDLGGLQYELDERLPGGADVTERLHPVFAPYIEPDLVKIL